MSILNRLLAFFGIAGAGILFTLLAVVVNVLFYGLIIYGILLLLEFLGVNVPILMLALA